MATVQLTVKSRSRKDGTYPLVFRIRHNRQYFDIPTNKSIPLSKFDRKRGRVIGNKELQFHLDEMMELFEKKVRTFSLQNISREFSFKELKSFVLSRSGDEVTIKEFWNERIQNLQKAGRGGSSRTYKNSLSVIFKIIDLERPFKALTVTDLSKVEQKLRESGNKYNSIAVYLRSFRAICNQAINEGLVDYEWYPFRKFKIRKEKTVPRVLSLEEMQKYFAAPISKDDSLYKVWNVGKLLFLMRGINLRDLLFLTKDDIKNGKIIYKRGKTGKMYSIKYTLLLSEVISTFNHERLTLIGMIPDSLLQNPSISLESRAQITKRVNSKLKQIGEDLNLNEKLTTYVFRYSYANIAKKLGYSKDLIAEALGHEYGNKITGIYLELFDLDKLDQMAEHIEKVVTQK